MSEAEPTRAPLGGDFRRLWSASAISNLGDGVLLAGGPLVVASLTDSPAAVAGALFAQQLPWLLFSLVSGAIVDRVDRRRLVVAVNLGRGVALVALALWLVVGSTSLWSVYVVFFLLGTGETLSDNAASALTPAIVPAEQLGRANARLSLTGVLGNQLVGPPLGAFLFVAGTAYPIGLDALSFLLAAVLVSRIRHAHETRPENMPGRRLWADVGEGIA